MTRIAQTGNSRVFLIEGGARPDHAPAYQSLMRAGGASRDYGDVETIEAPDPNAYAKYVTIGTVKGPKKRPTTSLTGRYLADTRSTLLRLAERGCNVDLQVHLGVCTNPSSFNTFTKAVVMEGANLANWKADDLGSLQSSEQKGVDEQADVSATEMYEVLPLNMAQVADTLIVSEAVDAVICGGISCGDCTTENSGVDHVYVLTTVRTGSPGLPAEVLYTVDGGVNWYTSIISSLVTSDTPSAIACLGNYLFVVGNAITELDYVPLVDLDGDGDETWTELLAQFTTTKEPNDIAVGDTIAWIVGKLGAIYKVVNPSLGATYQSAASALTVQNLNKVCALDDYIAVAVGDANTVLYTTDGETWSSVTGPSVGVVLTAVAVKSATEWLVGNASGNLYYTVNAGQTWTLKAFTGSAAGKVWDVVYASNSVIYLAHATAAPRGRVLRSYDGGYSWSLLPENGTLPTNQRITCLAASNTDVNFVVAGGLASGGVDGILFVGQA